TPILEIQPNSPDSTWAQLNEPAFTFVNDTLFGMLYNHAVISDTRGIAPEGWHIPTDEDWKQLEEFIGVSNVHSLGWRGDREAEDLVPKFSLGWLEGSYLFGTGKYGFEALPGGCRLFNGMRSSEGNMAFWWTATSSQNEAYYRYIDGNKKQIFRQKTNKNYGMSIRCVKN
ncbi:MAG: fibrobacter succinogenes major paralogous domain-containing protein, partial [Bacteroidota bacterium]